MSREVSGPAIRAMNQFLSTLMIESFRWHNHLDPNINKDPINREEEKKIFDLHK